MKRRREQGGEEKPARKPYVRRDSRPKASLTVVRTSNAEKKFVDLNQIGLTTNAAAGVGASGTWRTLAGGDALCNGLALGTAASARLGRKIVMKSILVRITVYQGVGNNSQSGPLRWIIFYDKQTNGANPAIAAADGAPLAYDHIGSPNNLYASDRYVTLFDREFKPVSGITNPGAPCTRTMMCYRKINLPVIYNDNGGGAVTDIQTGAVFFTCCTAGVTTSPNIDVMVRTRFLDE